MTVICFLEAYEAESEATVVGQEEGLAACL